jgi:hypothetical protein
MDCQGAATVSEEPETDAGIEDPPMPIGPRNALVERVIQSEGSVRAEGNCTDPSGDWVLKHFWAWRSVMRTLGNGAVLRHFAPTRVAVRGRRSSRSETPEPIANGDCTYPFGDRVLNRFRAWRSGMKTFSKVANQCHFVPFTENDS